MVLKAKLILYRAYLEMVSTLGRFGTNRVFKLLNLIKLNLPILGMGGEHFSTRNRLI